MTGLEGTLRVGGGEPSLPASLPTLSADLILLHPPAHYDFRRGDCYFPFPITPLYDHFPLGFKELQRFLGERGHDVRIVNLCSLLLTHRALDLEAVARALRAKLVGIDLHWMVHVQGCLAVAERVKAAHPETPVVLGGISATYYAQELIRYPFVDMVMRGYDTLEPMAQLLATLEARQDLGRVPNLLWKSGENLVRDNGTSYRVSRFGCGIDWSTAPSENGSFLASNEILSSPNTGCLRQCGWCGGSGRAFHRIYGTARGLVRKPASEVRYEFEQAKKRPCIRKTHLYSLGTYNEDGPGLELLLEQVGQAGFASVNYEQFELPSESWVRRAVRENPRTAVTLSPESHDLEVARLAGRGVYTNEEMEDWIARALDGGIYRIDVWYFVGMPRQDEDSVKRTLDYCERLLARFEHGRVHPMICPMMPFLDPASDFFERPEDHGYRLFYRTVEEHRTAAQRASPIRRINYETRWLKREEIFSVGLGAVRRLMTAKAEARLFSVPRAAQFAARIDDALAFTRVLDEIDLLEDGASRRRELDALRGEIGRRNDLVLYGGLADQRYPITRPFGGRWFDELGWSPQDLGAGQVS